MTRPGGFLDWWGHRHLASNIVVSETQQPLSNRYIVLKGKNANVLVFGFLYNMLDPSAVVSVSMVEDVVQQGWFRQALATEQYDAIMVMAHMGHEDASVDVLLTAIRNQVGDSMPVQFITGHTHLRQYGAKDALSASMEAGRYLDTVGFLSFPRQDTAQVVSTAATTPGAATTTNLFQHVFLDANVEVLRDTLGVAELETRAGADLAAFIDTTAEKLGLTEKIGCAPRNYYMNRTIESKDSLWKLYKEQLVPTQFLPRELSKRVILVGQGSWRYDLLGLDNLQVGDIFAVDPFNETIYYHGLVPEGVVLALNATLNQYPPIAPPYLPAFILAGDDIRTGGDERIKLFTHKFKADEIHTELKKLYPAASEPEMTNMSSTTLWMSFVRDQWSCDGHGASTPPWYRETAERATDNVRRLDPTGLAILIACITLMFLILMILASWCLKRVLFGDANTQEELSAINLNRDDLVLS
jgi:hypothetical protein